MVPLIHSHLYRLDPIVLLPDPSKSVDELGSHHQARTWETVARKKRRMTSKKPFKFLSEHFADICFETKNRGFSAKFEHSEGKLWKKRVSLLVIEPIELMNASPSWVAQALAFQAFRDLA